MNSGNWTKIKFDKGSFSTIKIFIYALIVLIPCVIILSVIHEGGHIVMGLIFNWNISEVHISFFPFTIADHSYVIMSPKGHSASPTERALVFSAGSLSSLLFAYIFFFLYYKYELPVFVEIFLFIYSVILLLDMVIYGYCDIFFLQEGDWYYVYRITPAIAGVFLAGGLFNLFLFVKNFNTVILRVPIE